MVLLEQLDEAAGGAIFLCCWDCIEDALLTTGSGLGVIAGCIAGGLATGALGLSRSECYEKDLLVLDLKVCYCRHPCTSLSALRAR
jgi:hypothetical protein